MQLSYIQKLLACTALVVIAVALTFLSTRPTEQAASPAPLTPPVSHAAASSAGNTVVASTKPVASLTPQEPWVAPAPGNPVTVQDMRELAKQMEGQIGASGGTLRAMTDDAANQVPTDLKPKLATLPQDVQYLIYLAMLLPDRKINNPEAGQPPIPYPGRR